MNSDPSSNSQSTATASDTEDGSQAIEMDEGRYLYCLVKIDNEQEQKEGEDVSRPTDDHVETTEDEFETTGIDDEPVELVTVDKIGAVVHSCSDVYDSADLSEVRRWLVRHQSVVDDAGKTFGTPVPFQFDTIIRGDDEAVREWIHDEREQIERVLELLSGHWEYRVDVLHTEPIAEETLVAEDDELAALQEQIDEATEGKAFLLEKQYEQRKNERRATRRSSIATAVQDRLEAVSREVHEIDRSPGTSLEMADDSAVNSGEDDSDAGSKTGSNHGTESADRETVCRLTLLAHEETETAIGSILDDFAAEPNLEIRFTGPWPPYSFVPAFGGQANQNGGADQFSGQEHEHSVGDRTDGTE